MTEFGFLFFLFGWAFLWRWIFCLTYKLHACHCKYENGTWSLNLDLISFLWIEETVRWLFVLVFYTSHGDVDN